MTEPNSQNEKPKDERRYDPELLKKNLRCDRDQYEMLKRCSDKNDISEWNKWRETNKEDIYLEGANLGNLYLNGSFFDEDPVKKHYGKVYLRNAVFRYTKLEEVHFFRAHLENADFHYASLKGAYLQRTHLEGSDFSYSDLRGAQLPFCTVDGSTIFSQCEIDRHTWFYCVGLDSIRIEPATKQRLEYNIRRNDWEAWYKYKNWQSRENERHIVIQKLIWFIRLFWSFSDYGRSTWRIAAWFFGLAFAFAGVYYLSALVSPPGIVSSLLEG